MACYQVIPRYSFIATSVLSSFCYYIGSSSDYTIAKVSEKIFIKELLGSLIRGWVNVQSNRISEGP